MAKVKNGFIFRSEWAELLRGVSDEVRLSLYDAMVDYALHGKVAEFEDDVPRVAFAFVRTMIDKDFEKSQKISAMRSEAGKRGMEVRFGKRENPLT